MSVYLKISLSLLALTILTNCPNFSLKKLIKNPDSAETFNKQDSKKDKNTMFNIFKTAPKAYQHLDGKTFKENFNKASKAELIDVRTAEEFAGGSIKGARNLDIMTGQLQASLASLDKDKEYFVFCRSGNRSASACKLMAGQGFKVYNLVGGIGAWPR